MLFKVYTINHQWRSKYKYGATKSNVTYITTADEATTRMADVSTRATTSTDYDYLIDKIAQLEARINQLEGNAAI